MKILIVKTSALGDIVHTFPVVAFLRHHCKDAKIDWLVGEAGRDLVASHPGVDRALSPSQVRSTRYDLLLDFQANCKSGLYTLRARAKRKVGFGGWALAEWPNWLATKERFTPPKGKNIRLDYLYLAARALDLPLDESFAQLPVELISSDPPYPPGGVVVCPGSAQKNKQLKEEEWVALLNQIEGKVHFVWGGEEERQFVERLQSHFPTSEIVPKRSLAGLQSLMARADLVISVDSVALHLCGTTKTPSLGLFGPSSSNKYVPMGEHHRAIQGGCPYGKTFEKRCPILRSCPTAACMRQIQPPPKTSSPS